MEDNISRRFNEVKEEIYKCYKSNTLIDLTSLRPGSNKKIWFKCPKNRSHIYQTKLSNRCYYNSNCPFCAGKKVLYVKSFDYKYKGLYEEYWDQELNEDINLGELSPGSSTLVKFKDEYNEVNKMKLRYFTYYIKKQLNTPFNDFVDEFGETPGDIVVV